ncbi:MAG TPA: hypothetical protein V6C84_12980 [Coleofasciculaceae cyanobacterium]
MRCRGGAIAQSSPPALTCVGAGVEGSRFCLPPLLRRDRDRLDGILPRILFF